MNKIDSRVRGITKDNDLIRVPAADLREYWRRMSQGQGRTPPGASEQMLPLGLYGDDARFTKSGDKVVMVSMNVLLHDIQKGELKRYVIWTLREYLSLGTRSVFPVCRVLAWSFNATLPHIP